MCATWWRSSAAAAVAVALLPVLATLHLVFNVLSASYIFLYSGLVANMPAFPPHPTIDFNVGVLSEAQGRRVAIDIFSGIMPWWNPFEGVGAPLTGNMQSAALFPPILLLGLPNGFLVLHLLLQAVAGLFTYLLMRRLGVSILAAFTSGVLFEFSGSFAWLPEHPTAFLPMLLFAVEGIISRRPGGWRWVAVALALSLYAGFPEIAYINGLLVAVWTLARLAPLRGRRVAGLLRIGLGVGCGLALSAPILVAFNDFLASGYVALHSNGFFSHQHLDPKFAVGLGLPYAFGLIFTGHVTSAFGFWATAGGYFGVGLSVLGIVGLLGRRYFGLRMALLLWLLCCTLAVFGLPGGKLLIAAAQLSNAAVFRYFYPSFAMALAVLAGLALDDMRAASRRGFHAVLVSVTLLLALGLWAARRPIAALPSDPWLMVSVGVAGVVLAGMAFASHLPPRQRRRMLSAIVIGEALFNFLVPSFSYPRHPKLELGGIHYLQAHVGMQRVYAMGPMQPNYGSYFGIAEIDDCDLPIPTNWYRFRRQHLDRYAGWLMFNGQDGFTASHASIADAEFERNFATYEAIGVRYVLARPDAMLAPGLPLPVVYSDAVMKIYELPKPRPYFDAAGCVVKPLSREEAMTDCAAPSSLTRLELYMPGWSARVAGRRANVLPDGEIFQRVALPAGRAEVRFAFRPPYMGFAYALFWVGVLLCCVSKTTLNLISPHFGLAKPVDKFQTILS